MYSFAQRLDTVVFDEPLYGAYLSKSNAHKYHPGAKEIMASMTISYQSVFNQMLGPQKKPIAFFKNMAHHLFEPDIKLMSKGMNIILTRNPIEMLPSFDKVISNPKIDDVGYKAHVDLLNYMDSYKLDYVVLDATFLLKNPERVLRKLCKACGIAFDPTMLEWTSGSRPEDGVWAKYWYQNVHRSTGFQPYTEKSDPFPKHLLPLLKECERFYSVLVSKALK
tara:strand:- start:542 stop:1207 length:666 start_codon:yes stop_codon:yes gene_type:complete